MLSDVCLSDVCRVVAYIRSAGDVCRPAGWRVLADRARHDPARLGRPGSRLPLRASVAGLGGGISWRPPAYSLLGRFPSHENGRSCNRWLLDSGTSPADLEMSCSTRRCDWNDAGYATLIINDDDDNNSDKGKR